MRRNTLLTLLLLALLVLPAVSGARTLQKSDKKKSKKRKHQDNKKDQQAQDNNAPAPIDPAAPDQGQQQPAEGDGGQANQDGGDQAPADGGDQQQGGDQAPQDQAQPIDQPQDQQLTDNTNGGDAPVQQDGGSGESAPTDPAPAQDQQPSDNGDVAPATQDGGEIVPAADGARMMAAPVVEDGGMMSLAAVPNGGGSSSSLWPKFNPAGRLMDWSYAGYNAGETDLPNLQPTRSVKDHGAKGDGKSDDTKAFIAAFAACKDGDVLFIPAGRYKLTQRFQIDKRVSIKGEGSDKVTLFFPKSLTDIYGDPKRSQNGGKYGTYSFQRAFINYWGRNLYTDKIGDVTQAAKRGATTIKVSNTGGIKAGEWVSVVMGTPNGGDLFKPMNLGVSPGCTDAFCRDKLAYGFQTRVASVQGNTLTLERPLPWDLFGTFKPWSLYRWNPKLSNVGVEGLGFDFASGNYKGHFTEPGFNAIELSRVANSWVRDIRINNADYGINVVRCSFITVTDVVFTANKDRPFAKDGTTGHHAMAGGSSTDVLFTRFDLQAKYTHDLSVDKFARGVVWSDGKGVDLNMDHHRAQTFGILWVNLDFGAGKRAFKSSGGGGRGLHAGTFTTYWGGQSSSNALAGLTEDFGPGLNFVGIPSGTPFPNLNGAISKTWLVEKTSPPQPNNIFQAQRDVRMGSPNKVSPQLGHKGNGGQRLDQY